MVDNRDTEAVHTNQNMANITFRPSGFTTIIDTKKVNAIIISARLFARRSINRSSCQFLINGPNTRFASNHLWNRGDVLAKQAAAKIIKGVVGKMGKTTPIAPNPKLNQPALNTKK